MRQLKLSDFGETVQRLYKEMQSWPEWKKNALRPAIPEERDRTKPWVYLNAIPKEANMTPDFPRIIDLRIQLDNYKAHLNFTRNVNAAEELYALILETEKQLDIHDVTRRL